MAYFDRRATEQELRDYLGEFADRFDIDGIADDLRDLWDTLEDAEFIGRPWTIDEVDGDCFLDIIRKHEKE